MSPIELLAELPVPPEEYAATLVAGVERRRDDVASLLGRHATGWTVDRMPPIDRCVLEIATYELLEELEVPVAVALDEAVELVKAYSTEDSSRFVNGVLAAIATEVRGASPTQAPLPTPAPSAPPRAAPPASAAPSPTPAPSAPPTAEQR